MIFICFDSLDRKLHVVTVLNKSAHIGESRRCSSFMALKDNELNNWAIISIPAEVKCFCGIYFLQVGKPSV